MPLHEPSLKGNELAYVTECIQTGWVSSVGSFVDRFERDLAAYTGAAHAVVVSNGTSALQIALHLIHIPPQLIHGRFSAPDRRPDPLALQRRHLPRDRLLLLVQSRNGRLQVGDRGLIVPRSITHQPIACRPVTQLPLQRLQSQFNRRRGRRVRR